MIWTQRAPRRRKFQPVAGFQWLLGKIMEENHGFWGSSALRRKPNKSINADPMSNTRNCRESSSAGEALEPHWPVCREVQGGGRLMAQRLRSAGSTRGPAVNETMNEEQERGRRANSQWSQNSVTSSWPPQHLAQGTSILGRHLKRSDACLDGKAYFT